MALLSDLAAPATAGGPDDVFSYLGGRFLFDLHKARQLTAGHEALEVDEDSVRESVAEQAAASHRLQNMDPDLPGIIAHVELPAADGTLLQGHVLIDGHARAAHSLEHSRPFLAYVLSPEESRAALAQTPESSVSPKKDEPAELHVATTEAYAEKFQASKPWSDRSRAVIAGATTHDRRGFGPFGVYIDRAEGVRKWDVAGNEMLDYWMGHGALLCGHGFAPVMQAVAAQLERGTHYGASHMLEVRWAELVSRLVPSAERVRFTASGTEATLLALRVARAFTGRQRVIKFNGHFHGWHDEAMAHFYPEKETGFNLGGIEQVSIGQVDDLQSVVDSVALGDVAAILLEPAGGSAGGLPWSPEVLKTLRQATRDHGTLLIFDEVISGFRHSPGGVQATCGIVPDMTTLAKILCGGLPGGAVVGRGDIMSVFGHGIEMGGRLAKVPHTGTFNANPLSAAAGIAMLEHIADGVAQEKARRAAEYLALGINAVADEEGVDIFLYTNGSSIYHILIGARGEGLELAPSQAVAKLNTVHPLRYALLRRALLVEGIDTHPVHGWVSAIHDKDVLDRSIEAFGRVFHRLRDVDGFRRPGAGTSQRG